MAERAVDDLDPDVGGRQPTELDGDLDAAHGAGRRSRAVDVDRGDHHGVPRLVDALPPGGQLLGRLGAVGQEVDRRCGGGLVEGRRVVADHPGRGHLRSERRPRFEHHLHPLRRHAVATAVVEVAHDLVLEDGEQAAGLAQVAPFEVRVVVGRVDRPPVGAVVALVPPAVEDAHVEGAVQGGLHPARAAGLERPARRVQPHVAAAVHRPGDRDVVVGEEHEPVSHVGGASELLDALDQLLAGRVCRVGLAGEDELHGTLAVVQQGAEAIGVGEQQRRPLVGGEAAGEADRQHGRIEDVLTQALAGETHEVVAAVVDRRPRFQGVDATDAGPARGVGPRPVLAHDAAEEGVDPRRDPGPPVHAVGHGADRHFVDREVGPQALEHLPADGPVEAGHAVRACSQAQAHHGHVELRLLAARQRLIVVDADGEQLVERHPALGGEGREVRLEQGPREAVDPRRDGRVRGEHAAAADDLDGGVEGQTLAHELADALQPEEPGVALVGVEHVRGQPEGAQGAHATDAEDDLLAQTVVLVAAVEAIGDRDAVGRVAGDVGVEQVQRDATDVGAPDVDLDLVAGEVDGELDARVDEAEGVGREVGDALLLPAARRRGAGGSSPRCTAGRRRRAERRGPRRP